MMHHGAEESPAAQIVEAAMDAYARGDLDGLKELIHPDAEIQLLLLGGERTRGPDELHETLQHREGVVHQPSVIHVEAISDDAAILVGRIQYTDTRGGLTDREAAWLTVVREGKVWRASVYASADEARTAYARMGSEAADGP